MKTTVGRSVVLTLLVVVLSAQGPAACSRANRDSGERDRLSVAVLPDRDPAELRERYTPLLDYLSERTGVSFRLVAADSYAHLLDLFRSGQIDIARFGGLTFLNAHESGGAAPLVSRDTDLRFTSYFLVRADNDARRLEDCAGMSIAFGSRLSTSGHLMPRAFMADRNIMPEEFFRDVRYSGAHNKTAMLVRDGIVDVGVANARVIERMYKNGELAVQQVRVLWETPPYADYVWAARPELDPALRDRLRNAFLMLSSDESQQARILNRLEANAFLPTSVSDFDRLRSIAISMGLLGGS